MTEPVATSLVIAITGVITTVGGVLLALRQARYKHARDMADYEITQISEWKNLYAMLKHDHGVLTAKMDSLTLEHVNCKKDVQELRDAIALLRKDVKEITK